MTERSDPLVDRFDEAYIVEKTVDLVHGDDTYRIEIVRDLSIGALQGIRAERRISMAAMAPYGHCDNDSWVKSG